MPSVPRKIVAQCLKHLKDDRASLKSCSLVCKKWVSLAQRHLFTEFSIHTPDSRSNELCKRLYNLLTESPHLSRYFRRIDLILHDFAPESRERIADEESLQSLLRLFINAMSLTLACGDASWSELPPNFLSGLQCLISNPSFEDLRLINWSFYPDGRDLVAFLQHGAAEMVSLEIETGKHAEFPHDGSAHTTDQPVELVRLEFFTIYGEIPHFHKDSLKMPRLEQFERTLVISPTNMSKNILPPCVPDTVVTLILRLFVKCDTEDDIALCQFPDFSDYPHMLDLELSLDCVEGEEHGIALQALGQFFAKVQTANWLSLENITLHFFIEPLPATSEWKSPAWEAINASLAPLLEDGALRSFLLVLPLKLGTELADPRLSTDDYLKLYQKHAWEMVEVTSQLRKQCRNLVEKEVLDLRLADGLYTT